MPARPQTGIPSLRTASRVEPGASLPAPTPKTPPSSQQRHRHTTPILVLVFHVQRLLVYLSSACRASNGLSMSAQATAGRWEGRSTQALRKKLFYEIAVFVLGCGNPVIVLLLWPGWLIVGGLAFVLWWYFV
ncbi:hypothetical protein E4U13_005481 [Claviceps humidiphila]|uniref:Uncharacterized protein n=1 Tax=Claviceps humidiphila TaxID=1294629 RepID=A0A9P7PVV9_9HYPO|nr:hypothetical protein E4U13_005481 [Claviceps humidiphila]